MNPNRELHELFGHCWHTYKYEYGLFICTCGYATINETLMLEHINASNDPDYATEPWLVIREMEKRKDGKLFFAKLIYAGDNVEAIDDDGLINRDLILDTTGKLRDLAIEWMKE